MPRFITNPFTWIILIALIGGGYLVSRGGAFSQDELKAQVAAPSPVEIPFLDAVLVQVNGDSNERRVLFCNIDGCAPKNPPASVGVNPLSDGANWYRYAEHKKDGKQAATVLEKVDSQGKVSTITEENPLVRPRAMILSTDGTKLAYFLDNIHDASDLTELWVYDSKEGGTKVVAEGLERKNVASPVRWNASSRVAWFLKDGKKKELVVAALGSGLATPRFSGINWDEHGKAADSGVMDINDNASLIAFVEPITKGLSRLIVARDNQPSIQRSVKGNVVFVQWTENDGLFYAVQDGNNLTFWMATTTKEWPITRMSATFESAHNTGVKNLAAFIASPRTDEMHLYVLDLESGRIKDEAAIPHFKGKTYLVQVKEAQRQEDQEANGSAADGILVAFLEKHMKAITEDRAAKASRILLTDATNTMFIDYTDGSGEEQRVLVSIIDPTYAEWKVLGRYKTINGIWKRTQESGSPEPTVTRLYEWEDALSQWVLKQAY